MTRAPIVLSATVAGLAATLGFHARTPAASGPAITATTATTKAAPTATTATASTASATRTVTSAVEANQYGNVQLKVTIKGARITAVTAVQIPTGDPKSAEINAYAEPILQRSALTAQSASIDAVSGATYTSTGYKAALQSALAKANVSTSTATGS
jgi:uncharacterized protein with FMN-binding domain